MEFVLEEAIELLGEDSDQIPEFKLILNAMKYLPFINSADVTQKLLDMIEIGTIGAQLEILYSIPEIIPDSQYEEAAKKLSHILESNTELTSAIIDCLNSLNLSSETRIEIQQN
ncbi:Fanconi anemia protein FancD2 nuclease [Popillia japonica]|uniref:Fanconi anemia protein FancD2 nuclease n=1 Tax=Popillia japonica TaxID=7064 RepID=A0AAW1NAM3_POPJA